MFDCPVCDGKETLTEQILDKGNYICRVCGYSETRKSYADIHWPFEDDNFCAGYLDNVLTPEERILADIHLSKCKRCSDEVIRNIEMLDYLSVPENLMEPPAELKAKVMATVERMLEKVKYIKGGGSGA